jgi:glycosyltransferase involved in cell wall biosynthesis
MAVEATSQIGEEIRRQGQEAAARHASAVKPGPNVSVLVLTKDEEINIVECLKTLAWSDDIVVLDSFSTDRTCEWSLLFPNVRVIQRKFDNWSRHSNWALEHIQFKNPWVYYSDADERMTDELRDEIRAVAATPSVEHVAFRVRYKNMFMGRWLRHGGIYPVWIIRLFKPEMIRYEEREVNAHPIMKGSLGDLREHFIHYSFNKGLLPWFKKHNSYSTMEANEAVKIVRGATIADKLRVARKGETPGERRRALKDLSFFIPLRGFARFLHMYFVKLGILDGKAGFHYAAMISMYEYWIELKMREQEKHWKDATGQEVDRLLDQPSTPIATTQEPSVGMNPAGASAHATSKTPEAAA